MSSDNIFYVYEHWRPDKDECFYVGKGKYPKRAFDIKNRTKWHKAVTSKLIFLGFCVEVRIVLKGVSESHAFKFEIERIAYWRGLGIQLVNLTDGGEGKSGHKMSEETLAKMRAAAAIRNIDFQYLEKLKKATTETWQRPGYREKVSALISSSNKGVSRGPCSEETKRKIGLANSGRKMASPMAAEVRAKIGAALRGRPLAETTKIKISAANTGKKRTIEQIERLRSRPPLSAEAREKIGAISRGNKYRLGKTHTEQARAKLRALGIANVLKFKKYSHLGPKSQARRVLCVDDNLIFESTGDAARHYGLKHAASISEVCLGKKYRYTAAGKRFKYLDASEVAA